MQIMRIDANVANKIHSRHSHTFAVWHYFIKSAETHDDPNSNNG